MLAQSNLLLADLSSLKISETARVHLDLNTPSSWSPPPPHRLKFNCDGAFDSTANHFCIAGILRDCSGFLVDGFSKNVCASSALACEALAIREACRLSILRERL